MVEQLLPMLAQAPSYIPKKVHNNHPQHYFDYYYIVIIMSFVVVIRWLLDSLFLCLPLRLKNGRVPYIWVYYNIFYKVEEVVGCCIVESGHDTRWSNDLIGPHIHFGSTQYAIYDRGIIRDLLLSFQSILIPFHFSMHV